MKPIYLMLYPVIFMIFSGGCYSSPRCSRCLLLDNIIAKNELDKAAIPMSDPLSSDKRIARMEAFAITRAAVKFIPLDDTPITMECYYGMYRRNIHIMGEALVGLNPAHRKILEKVISDYTKSEKAKYR